MQIPSSKTKETQASPPIVAATSSLFRAKQAGVRRGAAGGALIVLITFGAAIRYGGQQQQQQQGARDDRKQQRDEEFEQQLKLCLKSLLGPAASLWLHILVLAVHRFVSPQDIDGSIGVANNKDNDNRRPAPSATATTYQAVLQNTLEQTVYAACVYLSSAAVLPGRWRHVVPTAGGLFVLGRLLFFRGYFDGAPSRSLGFALTFFSNTALLLLNVLALLFC